MLITRRSRFSVSLTMTCNGPLTQTMLFSFVAAPTVALAVSLFFVLCRSDSEGVTTSLQEYMAGDFRAWRKDIIVASSRAMMLQAAARLG